MKIAILTDGVYPYVLGGMQRHSAYLTRYLANAGIEVLLVHCVPAHSAIIDEEKVRKELEISDEANFKSLCLNFPAPGVMPGHYLKENYQYSESIYNHIKDEVQSFDFIYAKGFSGWHIINRKKKGYKLPPIGVKFHGYEMFQQAPSFRVKLEHFMLRSPVKFNNKYADYIFSYGGKITEILLKLKFSKDKIIEIPTGIAADWCRADSITSDSLRKFVFIGRNERRKGIEELNEVLNKLVESEHFEFHFVGPIPKSKHIRSEKIIYHGKVMEKNKLQDILQGGQVLVSPSHSEGMPNVIMEGMAQGLAIIATDVGAVAAMVDEKNGWLINPGDTESLETAILNAMNTSNEELNEKRKQSVERVRNNFTWERVSEQTIAALKKIVNA